MSEPNFPIVVIKSPSPEQIYSGVSARHADGKMHLSPGCGVPIEQIHPEVKE